MTLLSDGAEVAWATLFCNPAAQHMALVSPALPYDSIFGRHAFTLRAVNLETVSGYNDGYYVPPFY